MTHVAIDPKDTWLIYNTTTGAIVESHPSKAIADHFAKVGNDHETKNGRPAIYAVTERG